MPPLQDSALRLSNARKTRLEVFFHFFIIFYFFIMDLVLQVHKAFIQVKYGPLSSQCYILQLCHPRCLLVTPFFYFFILHQGFTFMGLVTQKGHPFWSASPPQFGQVGAAIVLSKHVFSLAALLRITRASCEYHPYKRG